MRNLFIASFTVLALGACGTSGSSTGSTGGTGTGSGSGTTGGSPMDAGPTTITFTTVEVHPAAVAALNDAGFPIPSITNGAYQLAIDGVSITTNPLDPILLTDAGFTTITSTTGPYAFALSNEFFANGAAELGVIGVVRPAGVSLGDGGLEQTTCAQFALLSAGVQGYIAAGAGSVVQDFLLDAGFRDYLMPTGLEVGGEAVAPTADIPNAIAYAIPMSYAVMLNCAGNPTKTTRDTDIGVAIAYVTNGAAAGEGSPVAGASVSVVHAAGTPQPTYYENNYTATDLMTQTDSTGIATFTGISPTGDFAPTMSVKGVPGYTASYAISTQPNAFFSIVAYPH